VPHDDGDMKTSDFDYDLPEELIAQRPPEHRGESRMMVVHRQSGTIEHRRFGDLLSYLHEDDLAVLNDTRVVAARFFSNDGRKELLRTEVLDETNWRCLVKPGKRLRQGHTIAIGDSTGTVVEVLADSGERVIRFDRPPDENRHGHYALPPYIDRPDDESDRDRYQTVFAREPGAIAAPTAGLHFSPEMLEKIPHAFVTLHVGVGTFRPVSAEHVADHTMHSERYTLGCETAERIHRASRVLAVGTTVVRVLESCYRDGGRPLQPRSGETDIFIHPPYEFGAIDLLLTNFHLPRSSLIMLVSAFAGMDLVREAYREAVHERYRFFSYGDCMMLL